MKEEEEAEEGSEREGHRREIGEGSSHPQKALQSVPSPQTDADEGGKTVEEGVDLSSKVINTRKRPLSNQRRAFWDATERDVEVAEEEEEVKE